MSWQLVCALKISEEQRRQIVEGQEPTQDIVWASTVVQEEKCAHMLMSTIRCILRLVRLCRAFRKTYELDICSKQDVATQHKRPRIERTSRKVHYRYRMAIWNYQNPPRKVWCSGWLQGHQAAQRLKGNVASLFKEIGYQQALQAFVGKTTIEKARRVGLVALEQSQ